MKLILQLAALCVILASCAQQKTVSQVPTDDYHHYRFNKSYRGNKIIYHDKRVEDVKLPLDHLEVIEPDLVEEKSISLLPSPLESSDESATASIAQSEPVVKGLGGVITEFRRTTKLSQDHSVEKEAKASSATLGILGFVFGLLGLLLFWFPIINIIFSVIGLVFSIQGLGTDAHGLALAGLILSSIALLLSLLIFI